MRLDELREIPYFDQAPKRIISLIPSMTENLFLLGFGSFIIGITDYCIHPAEKLEGIERVGGPKNPDIVKIVELAPDLVILNQEESTPQVVQDLEVAGVKMWVTFPKTVDDAMDILDALLGIFKNDKAAIQLKSLQTTLDFVQLSCNEVARTRYFCPIWQDNYESIDWMMTFNDETYSSDLLRVCGGVNVFGDRKRYYPLRADLGLSSPEDSLKKDVRYPRVTLEEVIESNPELILLPNEPFEFEQSHLEDIKHKLAETDAVKNERIFLVDGTLLFWPGVRLGQAFQILPNIVIV